MTEPDPAGYRFAMRPVSPNLSLLPRLRGTRWRAAATMLLAAGLLAQILSLAIHLGAHAAVPFWDDPSSICGEAGAPNGAGGTPNKEPLAACPICQAAHQLATALTPASPVVVAPSRVATAERTLPRYSAAIPSAHRPQFPRGPPAAV